MIYNSWLIWVRWITSLWRFRWWESCKWWRFCGAIDNFQWVVDLLGHELLVYVASFHKKAFSHNENVVWPSKFKWNENQHKSTITPLNMATQANNFFVFAWWSEESRDLSHVLLEATIDTNINFFKLICRVPYYVLWMIQWFSIVGWFACNELLVYNATRPYW